MQLNPGPHFRIPFVDVVTLVNTRQRITATPPVTIQESANSDRVQMITATIAFLIRDPLAAIMRFEQPTITLQGYASAEISIGSSSSLCEERLRDYIDGHGIEIEYVRYTDNVTVPALRLLQNSWGTQSSEPGRDEHRY